ncbi:replicative DNA helicase [Candidatus Microgenomates bacterium]|nr:replicative DNA helicase [Candidatus Microgenomates bacterium]
MSNLKVPPHNEEAEQSVLGALLIDKDAIVEIVDFLRPEHFYNEKHGQIFDAILELYEAHEPVDLVTLTEKLKKKKFYKEIGGAGYLSDLANIVPTAAHIEQYGRIIQDHYTKRELISAAAKLTEIAFDEGVEAKKLLDQAEQAVFGISSVHSRQNFIPIKDVLTESFDRLDELHKQAGGIRGVSTGFKDLDNKLAGLQDSNLLILAARPGLGKTSLAINIAQHVAVERKIPVGVFSLEMSKEELVDRLLVSQGEIDAWRLKTGRLKDEDWSRLQRAMGELADAPIYIDDTPGISILEIRTKARKLQVEAKVRLLIVDYLQLVDCGRRFDSRVQEVSMVSQSMKNLARELRVPVLAISQLSRAVESRGTKVPQLADLRESGAIEQDADVVMFLYREEDEGARIDQFPVKLLIAKHRNGPTGEVDLIFRGDRIRFYGVDRQRESAAA